MYRTIVLSSVNVGESRSMTIGSRARRTGIFKEPANGPVRVTELGLQDDAVVDTRHHGGPDQAVYLYSGEDYAWWTAELDRDVHPGLFGDNFTLSSFGARSLRIGDRFHLGADVTVEVTAPRIPCSTLATRMGDPSFVKRFAAARRPGAYGRVLRQGLVEAGDEVRFESASDDHPTVLDVFDLWYAKEKDPVLLTRLLEAPIAIRSRRDIEGWLQKGQTAAP